MAGTLFDDTGESFGSASTFGSVGSGAATGFMVGGPAGAGIGAGIGLAMSVMQTRQQRKARQRQEAAIAEQQEMARQSKNRLVEESFRKRSRTAGQGASASLAPGQKSASTQGTSLLSAQDSTTPSLFGES